MAVNFWRVTAGKAVKGLPHDVVPVLEPLAFGNSIHSDAKPTGQTPA